MSETMKAVIFHGPKNLRLENVPMPKPGPDEVLIRVGGALTCGTDFKAYRQGHKVLLGKLPSPFGHELAGTVVEAGSGITRFTPGMRVVTANSAPCDACFFCAKGQNQLCENLKLHNGAYAEYNLVPKHIVRHNLWPIEDHVPFEVAALSEPLACAIHGVDAVDCKEGDTVVILGAGIMSRLLLASLVARGCRTIVVGRSPEPLVRARAEGASEVLSINEVDPVAAVQKLTGGRGADVVFEAVGQAATWQQAIAMTRKGGKVCLFGGCASGTEVPVDAHRVHYGQLTLFGVFHHTPKYFKAALDLISAGKLNHESLIADRISLDQVPEYFDTMHGRSNSKVAVIP
jgi:L-iditol 2-dehydrogenase